MFAKTSPTTRTDASARGRSDDASWTTDDSRGRDDLARLGLVDDRPEPADSREALTELRLDGGSPDRRRDPKGYDATWTTRRII
jgi:hypothetical protein